MKMKILMALAGAFLFAGCAATSGGHSVEINTVKQNPQDDLRLIGAERTVVLGPVFYMTEKKCSKIDFFKYVTSTKKDADAVIDIQMEESTLTQMGMTSYSCKYAGLAVDYRPMQVDDKTLFKAFFPEVSDDSASVSAEAAETAAPVAE
ncbi:hypothetical protein [Fibrobacter sp.]|uniref:hypothetical protein n=1 Tax=Fibrobacter sp. TaxID=35828 RepID=UPI00389011E1